jgi:hypothetical protein
MNKKHIAKGVAIVAALAVMQAIFSYYQGGLAAFGRAFAGLFGSDSLVDSVIAAMAMGVVIYLVFNSSEGMKKVGERINGVADEFVEPATKVIVRVLKKK